MVCVKFCDFWKALLSRTNSPIERSEDGFYFVPYWILFCGWLQLIRTWFLSGLLFVLLLTTCFDPTILMFVFFYDEPNPHELTRVIESHEKNESEDNQQGVVLLVLGLKLSFTRLPRAKPRDVGVLFPGTKAGPLPY